MFFKWSIGNLGAGHLKSMEQKLAGFSGFNNRINVTLSSSHVRVGKFFLVLLNLLASHFLGVGGFRNLLAENDVGCAFGAHNGNFSTRPCKYKIGTQVA